MGNVLCCASQPVLLEDAPKQAKGVVLAGEAAEIEFIKDAEKGPAKGLPYQVHYLGPPKPPCEEGRVATVRALNKVDGPEDPELASILKLVTSMFRAPVALVTLFDQKRVFVTEQCGNVVARGDFPPRWGPCSWTLAYSAPQVLVVPDMMQDARFADNAVVLGAPYVRFYCGAPLIASNGHRLGTICFMDVEARPGVDAGSCGVLNNMSEMVVRHLERDVMIKLKQKSHEQLQETYRHLQRALDCFEHTLVLLDTSVQGWAINYINAAWNKSTGSDRQEALGLTLRDVFDGFDGLQIPNEETNKAAKRGLDFQIGLATIKIGGQTNRQFSLSFRPACKSMDAHTLAIGVPSFIHPDAEESERSRRFYFMTVEPISTAFSMTSTANISQSMSSTWKGFTLQDEEVIEGLQLGHLLGKGSFGSVYYGTWMGTPVAVKVVDQEAQDFAASKGVVLEAILGKELKHPNVVITHKYVIKRTGLAGPGSSTATNSHAPKSTDFLSHGQKGSEPAKLVAAAAKQLVPQAEDEVVDSGNTTESSWPVIEWKTNDHWAGPAKASPAFERVSTTPTGQSQSKQMTSGSPRGGSASTRAAYENGPSQVWIMLEFCDKGCLQEAIDRGWLRNERSCVTGTPNLEAILSTAREVAGALAYLHSHNVLHGDLSSWNVMLCSAGSAASQGGRGFIAKIADFGMARTLTTSKVATKQYGTLTHMPPETLTDNIISKAVDVYSFGVILWQMYTGSRPWAGLTHGQIMMTVGQQFQQLQYPADAPASLVELSRACMHKDAEQRPDMERVLQMLNEM